MTDMNKKINQLLGGYSYELIQGNMDQNLRYIRFDSRKIEKGDLFVAIPGTQFDGHMFIEKAIEKGAIGVVAERMPASLSKGLNYIQVEDSAHCLGYMAHQFYGRPSEKLQLVGVTGTNGKTTTVNLLYDLFRALGYKCGMLSTIENKINGEVFEATHTTPDPVQINAMLHKMAEHSCDFAFMEVSSHAVHQKRIAGLQFAGGIFTNMSHDHLDYHKTMKAYIEAKKAFFDDLPKTAFALVNIDDKRGRVMIQNTKAQTYTYSIKQLADFRWKILENNITGLILSMGDMEVATQMIGEFNAYNLLAAYGAAILLQQDDMQTLTAISRLKAAEGRFDYVVDEQGGRTGIVDYAHTPDALDKVLTTINNLRKPQSRIITVVGCGGDRDRKKRPVMARTAALLSDQLILTSDNPRTEEPEAILRDMEAGLEADQKAKTLTITNRREAIRTACRLANKGDIILVAGKGHEKYQEINGIRHEFDDKAVLKTAFER
jgi:UDP-N-acetylmuramoyl-L-alanyl-D-glutamate--2,6-diaminopimelate ligase